MGQIKKLKVKMQTELYQNQEVINGALIENELLNEVELEEAANQLAAEQEVYQTVKQAEDIYKKGQSYKNPSKFKYGVLFGLSGIVDVIDFLTLTGVGWFIAAVISVVLSTVIILIFWFTNTKQKKANQYKKGVQDFLESLPKNVAHLERRTYQVLKISGLSKYAASAAANIIPALNLIPWNIFGVWLSYRDEKESYRDARETSEKTLGNIAQLTAGLQNVKSLYSDTRRISEKIKLLGNV